MPSGQHAAADRRRRRRSDRDHRLDRRDRDRCPTRPICRRRPSGRRGTATPPAPAAAPATVATPAPAAAPAPAPAPVLAAHRRSADPRRVARVRRRRQPSSARMIDRKNERTAVEAFYASRVTRRCGSARTARPTRAPSGDQPPAQRRCRGSIPPTIRSRRSRRAPARGACRSRNPADLSVLTMPATPRRPRALVAHQRRHLLQPDRARAADVLAKIADGQGAREALDSYNPPQPATRRSRSSPRCAAARATTAGAIARGSVLKSATESAQETAMQDKRVPPLRERLGVVGRTRRHDLRQGARRGGRRSSRRSKDSPPAAS